MNKAFNFGIVGTGMIANVVANAIKDSTDAKLAAVASRTRESADAFAAQHNMEDVFDHWVQLVASDRIDAVYISTPTAVREEVAIAAASHKKHILADKPFASLASVQRIVEAAKANGVAFMDATHFVHHPRTRKLQAELNEMIGTVQAIRTCFFFPFMDRTNIRFDTTKEPTGAIGDMAWYSMRTIVEYMQDRSALKEMRATAERDVETGAVIRSAGVAVFEDDKSSTFDVGYNAGVCLMDLDILGTRGMVRIDDFVLDWSRGFAFDDPNYKVGYTLRKEMMIPDQFEYSAVENQLPPTVHMINNFVQLAQDPTGVANKRSINATVQTQKLLDKVWDAATLNAP